MFTRTLADQILFDGKRATGVRVYHKGRQIHILASRAVILSAGAIASPAILQRSGIGEASLLRKQGIEVKADRKGVGANLQDHLEVYFQIACRQPITLYKHLNLVSKSLIGARWLMFKSGLGASNQFETLGFIRSDKNIPYPDIQYHFLPVAIRYDGTAPAAGHGFQLHVGPMRSKSRGHVKIQSSDPTTAPEIKFNYLSHPDDLPDFRKALRLSREILSQPAMAPFYDYEIQPGLTPPQMKRWMSLSAMRLNCVTTRAGLAVWDHQMIRLPWSAQIAVSLAQKICSVRIHPCSRGSPMAI